MWVYEISLLGRATRHFVSSRRILGVVEDVGGGVWIIN